MYRAQGVLRGIELLVEVPSYFLVDKRCFLAASYDDTCARSHGRFAYDILALIFTRQNNKLS